MGKELTACGHARTAVAVYAVSGLLAACGGESAGPRPTTTQELATPEVAEPIGVPVGMRTEVFVDTGRTTDDPTYGVVPEAAAVAQPTRTLRTQIYYPSSGDPGAVLSENAPPAVTDGPFPLVVFAHGNTVSDPGAVYGALFRYWARAGYVVAAPTFPVSSTRVPGGLSDVRNQPADVSFVISQVLALSATTEGPYSRLVDPQKVAVAGHSLGAMTAVGLVANTCCTDERIRAAVVMAGSEQRTLNGAFFQASARVPIMVIHGDADGTVGVAEGRKVFTDASPSKAMLTIRGGDHGTPFTGDQNDPNARLVAQTSKAFLDRYVKGQADGLDRVREAVAGNANAQLDVEEADG